MPHEQEDLHKNADAATRIRAAARRLRRTSLGMVHAARMGHPGGDLSCADILATLFVHVLRVNPAEPRDPSRDRFVLSKGHVSAALYATLAERGYFPRDMLSSYICRRGFEHHAAMNASHSATILVEAMQNHLGWDVHRHS